MRPVCTPRRWCAAQSVVRFERSFEPPAERNWSSLDPALLLELPDLSELPEGVQIGAEHMGGPETDVWVANVPADVGSPLPRLPLLGGAA